MQGNDEKREDGGVDPIATDAEILALVAAWAEAEAAWSAIMPPWASAPPPGSAACFEAAIHAEEALRTAARPWAEARRADHIKPLETQDDQPKKGVLPTTSAEAVEAAKADLARVRSARGGPERRKVWRGYARAALSGLLGSQYRGGEGGRLYDFAERAAVLATSMQAAEDERWES